MAQIPFFLISQANTLLTTADLVQIFKLSAPTIVVASTNPTGEELPITDNHDGIFIIDAEPEDFPTDVYLAKVNGHAQGEIAAVVFVNSDVVDHLNDAAKHREIDDDGTAATDLLSAAKILALLGDKAEQDDLDALETEVDGKLSASDIINDLTTGGASVPLSAEQGKTLKNYLGTLDMSSNGLLATYYNNCLQNSITPNISDFINILTAQILASQAAIFQGTAIYNNRIIYSDATVAANGDGQEAGALPENVETSTSPKIKRNGCYYPVTGDKILRVKCHYTLTAGQRARLHYDDDGGSAFVEISGTDGIAMLEEDVSNRQINNNYQFSISTCIVYGYSGTITIKNVEVSISGA